MIKSKKGVSPLIATVLIIALTVALSVFLMNWAFGFFKERSDETSRLTNEQLLCATRVQLDFDCSCRETICNYAFKNNANFELSDGIRVRLTSADGQLVEDNTPAAKASIDGFGALSGTLNPAADAEAPFDLEIIAPVVKDIAANVKVNCGELAKLRKRCSFKTS
jgi:flagellin-like protein